MTTRPSSSRRFGFAWFILAASVFAVSTAAHATPITVVTVANNLVTFDSTTPGTVSAPLAITGLQPAENLLGIDFRPANGMLYGLGSTSRLYTINPTTGAATQVGAAGAFALSGTAFGFDFNPTVDRIRETSDADQNLRLNPNDGTLAGTDGALNPGNPTIVGSAYTNNVAGALTTTLYGIDSNLDQLFVQNPPNNGTLTMVGPLGFNTSDFVGFDISGVTGVAYASLTAPGAASSSLYTINLTTGAATLIGTIGGGAPVTGLATAAAPVPEPGTMVLMVSGMGMGMLMVWKKKRGMARAKVSARR